MSNFVNWFEIPVTDFDRALAFYQHVLNTKIQHVPFGELTMGFFEIGKTQRGAFGAIVKGEGYNPSLDGTRITFSCAVDLQEYLDRVEPAGGKVIQPKTAISKEYGFGGRFQDTEGNIIGLHSEM